MIRLRPIQMGQMGMVAMAGLGAVILAACSSTSSAAPTESTSTVTVTSAPTSTATPSAVPPGLPTTPLTTPQSPLPSVSVTTIDPTVDLTPIRTDEPIPPFTGYWIGHDRDLTLNDNHTGTIMIGSGANESERWAFIWQAGGPTVRELTLTTRQSIAGTGTRGIMHAGATYSLRQARDAQKIIIMIMQGFRGENDHDIITWCRPGSDSMECGA